MNIVIINHYAGSPEMGMEYRPYYLAREWIKCGHKVIIIAASYSHLRNKNPDLNDSYIEELVDGITYAWISTPEYEGNGLGRIRNMFSFIRKTYFRAKYFAQTFNPDVVIASSTYPSDNYVARKIAKISGAKNIYEVHDLWPLSPMELGNLSKYNPFIMLMQHAENFAYKKADIIVSMLSKTKDYMQVHGMNPNKWHYIPNGISIEDWTNPKPLPEDITGKIDKLKEDGYFIIGYTGGHAPSNSLDTLVDAAIILKDVKDVFFLFVGNGIEKEKLIAQAEGLINVEFCDSIPKLAIPSLLEKIDVAVIGAIKSPLYRFGVCPNKLFDYMMAKRPIIQYIEAGNDIVTEADAGISIESGNARAIADAIIELKAFSKERLKAMGENGYKYVTQNHDYSILADQFLKIME